MADFVSLRLKDPAHRTKFSKALRYVSCASFCMAIITRHFWRNRLKAQFETFTILNSRLPKWKISK